MKRIKVLFVVPSLQGGGAERVAVTVLSALDPTVFDRQLYLFQREGVYFDRVAPDVRIVSARQRRWLGRLWELRRYLRQERPDVVMPFLSYFITAIATWWSLIPASIVFNQGTPTTAFLGDRDFSWRRTWRRRLFAALTRWFYARVDAVVVTSQGVADDLITRYRVPTAKLRVLHNPVDLAATRAGASADAGDTAEPTAAVQGAPIIVSAGRLAAVKNFPLLIEALSRLPAAWRTQLWILGEGVEREALETFAVAKNVGPQVQFLGFQPNPWRHISRANLFVLTSIYEGFGNVLIEAMACRTPVVATRSAGTSEVVRDGVNGLLVDHDAAAVATAMIRVLSDQPLRDRLVAQASRDVDQYATPVVARRYEQLFSSLCR